MAQDKGADAGKPDKSGNGAPEGDSSKDESGDGLDEKFEKRIKAALANQARQYETQIGSVRAEFEAFKAGASKAAPAKEAPKSYTKAELKAAVDGAQITQEQADDIWDRQRETQITERAEARALNAVETKAKQERISQDVARYKRLVPEVMDKGSETREKVLEEYRYLTGIGQAESEETELAAMRAALGPLEKLELAKQAERKDASHEDGGSSGERGKPGSKTGWDALSQRQKAHYEDKISKGVYKDRKAVEAELKYARPRA